MPQILFTVICIIYYLMLLIHEVSFELLWCYIGFYPFHACNQFGAQTFRLLVIFKRCSSRDFPRLKPRGLVINETIKPVQSLSCNSSARRSSWGMSSSRRIVMNWMITPVVIGISHRRGIDYYSSYQLRKKKYALTSSDASWSHLFNIVAADGNHNRIYRIAETQ